MEIITKLKIVIVGAENVGKTSLMNSIFNGSLLETNNHSYSDTGNDLANNSLELNESLTHKRASNTRNSNNSITPFSQQGQITKDIMYKNKTYRITLLDSESQTSATQLDNKYFSDINGYILVFSQSEPSSFDTIQSINNNIIKKVGYKYIPRVLVGNKSDVHSEIEESRIKRLSNKLMCPYIESSVIEGRNLDKIIMKMIKETKKENNEEHPYDIKNLGRELNFISRQAKLFRLLEIYMIYGVILISLLLFIMSITAIIDNLDKLIVTLPSAISSFYTSSILIFILKYVKNKDSEVVMRFLKFLVLSIIISLVIILIIVFDSSGYEFDYLSFLLIFMSFLLQINIYVLSNSIFPLYLSNFTKVEIIK